MLSLIRRYKVINTIGTLKITKLLSSTSTDDDIGIKCYVSLLYKQIYLPICVANL